MKKISSEIPANPKYPNLKKNLKPSLSESLPILYSAIISGTDAAEINSGTIQGLNLLCIINNGA